jgi:quinol monooxygenase YgiN
MEITVIVMQGNADRIHRAWKVELLPVAAPKAAEYGWRRSLLAAGDDEVVVVNVWEDASGLDRAFADPDIDRVQQEALVPLAAAPPEVRRLEVKEDLSF